VYLIGEGLPGAPGSRVDLAELCVASRCESATLALTPPPHAHTHTNSLLTLPLPW
jgi:hypothetical protein